MIDRIRSGGAAASAASRRVPSRGDPGAFAGMVEANRVDVPALHAVSSGSLIALQDDATDAVADRDARRDGEAMLAALAELQRDMLANRLGRERLEQLATLAGQARIAADPRLRAVVAAVGLRARVALARLDLPDDRTG